MTLFSRLESFSASDKFDIGGLELVNMKINVARLQYLLQISRSGGVLAAAEVMRLTPSALSQQLSRLEAEVGVPLMERSPRGMVPTAAGRELIELAESIEREINEAARRVGAASELPSGLVRFGGFPSFISGLLAPSLPRWRSELAGVHLEIVEDGQAELLRGLRTASLDLVAVEFDESAKPARPESGVHEVALLDDRWVLAAPAGTQAAMGVIELADLRLPWLEVDRGAGALTAVTRVRKTLPESVTSPHRYASTQAALALVAAGEGVTLLSQLGMRGQSTDGIEVHELPGLGVRHISLRYRQSRKPSTALSAAVEFLQALAADPDGLEE